MTATRISRLLPSLRFVLSLSAAVYIVCSVPVLCMAWLLLAHGETCQGRLFATAVLAGVPVPVLVWVASLLVPGGAQKVPLVGSFVDKVPDEVPDKDAAQPNRRSQPTTCAWKRRLLFAAAFLGCLCLLLLGIDYGLTPNGVSLPGSPIRSRFAGATAYHRASMANMVPEIDQLILGTYVVPSLDPLMDKPNTLELREQVRQVYGEMRRDPEFECLGSVMRQTYRDIFLGDRPVGHFYEYIPATARSGRLPVMIFLHGSLGNFRGYLWVWKRIADEQGIAVVAPTFGTGNWDEPGGIDAIEQARRYCAAHPRMDATRIYLAGLSNGGLGVCRGASRSPNAYRGMLFISPVLDLDALLTPSLAAAWKQKPVLILTGTADNRIPALYIRNAVETMRTAGLRPECQFYDGQTHFLFFTIRDQVRERIGKWLREH